MHISRQWLLPHLVPAGIAALTLSSIPARGQSPGASLPDLISLQEIRQEEFEPAIGEQIRLAYEQALRNTSDAEPVGRLGMILQCYGKYEPAEICYRRARGLAPHAFRWAYYLGNIEAWLGKNQDAVNHVREALTLDESYNPARVRLGQLLFESGETQEPSFSSGSSGPRPRPGRPGRLARGDSVVSTGLRDHSELRRSSLRARVGVPENRRHS
jgi:tetratricopeptide (TPR) repeat protein